MPPDEPPGPAQPNPAGTATTERRRPGRREYENAHLISLLRGAEPDAEFPTELEPSSRLPWGIVALAAVALWACIVAVVILW